MPSEKNAERRPLLNVNSTATNEQKRLAQKLKKKPVMPLVRDSWWKLVVLSCITLFICGPVTGLQGLATNVAERGVFEDKCVPNITHPNATISIPCQAQRERLDQAIDFITSMLNFSVVFGGVLVDALGTYTAGVSTMVLWCIFTCLQGISPSSGAVWTTCLCVNACVGTMAFLVVIIGFVPRHFSAILAYVSPLLTCTWDLGAALTVAYGYYFSIEALPFWLLNLILGAVIGLPLITGVAIGFRHPPKTQEEEQAEENQRHEHEAVSNRNTSLQFKEEDDDDDVKTLKTVHDNETETSPDDDSKEQGTEKAAEAEIPQEQPYRHRSSSLMVAGDTAPHAEEKVGCPCRVWTNLKNGVKATGRTVIIPLYIGFALNALFIVTYGYFLLANVATHWLWKGSSYEEAQKVRKIFTILMAAVGPPSALSIGHLFTKYKSRKGLIISSALMVVLVSAATPMILWLDNEWQYAAYLLVVIWRFLGFMVPNSTFYPAFAEVCKGYVSIPMGLLMTLAGGFSILVGHWTTHLVQGNPDKYFFWVHLGYCAGSILCGLILLATACTHPGKFSDDPVEITPLDAAEDVIENQYHVVKAEKRK